MKNSIKEANSMNWYPQPKMVLFHFEEWCSWWICVFKFQKFQKVIVNLSFILSTEKQQYIDMEIISLRQISKPFPGQNKHDII